jgi:hypothetical protein
VAAGGNPTQWNWNWTWASGAKPGRLDTFRYGNKPSIVVLTAASTVWKQRDNCFSNKAREFHDMSFDKETAAWLGHQGGNERPLAADRRDWSA